MSASFEALALIELSSIARGYVTLDQIAKRAMVNIRFARPVTPGKFIILFGGSVAECTESFDAAKEHAGTTLLDELFLPYAHADLLPAIENKSAAPEGESIGIVECTSVASTVLAADVALKATETAVLKMHLAIGIGGKGYFTLGGRQGDVEAALEEVREKVASERLIAATVIANPQDETRGWFS